jgi:choline-sulfatase
MNPRLGAAVLGLPCLVACSKGLTSPPDPSPAQVENRPAASVASAALPASAASASAAAAASLVPSSKAAPGPLNVILLSIDSLRQDMPWAGYPKAIAPNLTRLAEESVVYTHAYSVSSYTAKSVAAFLASRYPSSLYRSGWFFTDYAKANVFVGETLHDHGIHTMGLHAHAYFGRGKKLDQGFDLWEVVPGISFDATTDKNITSPRITDLGIKALSEPANTAKPFFLWLHYMDPHDEYMPHSEAPDFGKGNRSRYDGEVYFTDLHVGRLLEFAKKQPWWEKTAVIVTADHGEAFGEHGAYKHAFWLWDVLTRVPLVVHAPGASPSRIEARRSHVDLAPTILDLEGIKDVPPSFVGKSLVGEVYGAEEPGNRDPIVLDLPEDSHNPDVRAIIVGNSKLIVYGGIRYELFDLAADPGELHDLAKTEPAKLAEMQAADALARSKIPRLEPYGGMKLRSGKMAKGPMAPP